MKKAVLLFSFMAVSLVLSAQVKTPQPSPQAKIKQTVGLTDITVEYSRPSMKGRVIFGDLVPYNTLWRTGANANTKITFGDDVTVGGKELKAGTYAVYTKPGKEVWDVIFYSDADNWGTPREWDDTKVAAMVNAPVQGLPFDIQTFTMSIDDLTNNSANLGLMWANVYVGVPIEVPTQAKADKSITSVLSGPAANDYYSAAVYYLQEGKELDKAKTWIDKAVELTKDEPRFWYLRQQSLIYAKSGDTKGAIEAAKKSLAGAEKAGNANYVKMNKDSLKEWGAM